MIDENGTLLYRMSVRLCDLIGQWRPTQETDHSRCKSFDLLELGIDWTYSEPDSWLLAVSNVGAMSNPSDRRTGPIVESTMARWCVFCSAFLRLGHT